MSEHVCGLSGFGAMDECPACREMFERWEQEGKQEPKKPLICTHAGVVSQDECPYCNPPGQPCECPMRKALHMLPMLERDGLSFGQQDVIDQIKNVLSTPCTLEAEVADWKQMFQEQAEALVKRTQKLNDLEAENAKLRGLLTRADACLGLEAENTRLQTVINQLDGERTLMRANVIEPLQEERERLRQKLEEAREALQDIKDVPLAAATTEDPQVRWIQKRAAAWLKDQE